MEARSTTCTECNTVNYVSVDDGNIFTCNSCKEVSIITPNGQSIIFYNAKELGYPKKKKSKPLISSSLLPSAIISIFLLLAAALSFTVKQAINLLKHENPKN